MATRLVALTDASREIGAELAEWGKVALLETTGRNSGRTVTAAVGFAEGDSGDLLVAAGSDYTAWALNLRANPDCRATIGDRVGPYTATELPDGPARSSAIAQLILKYGTPAEKLGRGPVFRLTPAGA